VLNEISRSFLRIKAVSKDLNAPLNASVNSRFLFGEIGSVQTFGLGGPIYEIGALAGGELL
jgi:hypothetical protein